VIKIGKFIHSARTNYLAGARVQNLVALNDSPALNSLDHCVLLLMQYNRTLHKVKIFRDLFLTFTAF